MLKRVILIFLLLAIPVVADTEIYHLKLLAVQDNEGVMEGSDADLFLELKKGSGRVFLETHPLTKLDTQISTRFAKDIACDHFNLDCNRYDYIYTIRAKSNIIGGPSAGAAIAALTTIAVLDLDYRNDVAITGTINSGAIIGPVGGVKEKLDAASQAELKKVLIAKGAGMQKAIDENESDLDLISYGSENLSLEVLEVLNLDEIIFHLTGKKLRDEDFTIEENEEYNSIMKSLKENLCERGEKIEDEIANAGIDLSENTTKKIEERKESSQNATKINDYYSAASFCFSNNILLKTSYYKEKNLTNRTYQSLFVALDNKTKQLNLKLENQKIETISDLQTMMIVKERLNDVKNFITEFSKTNSTERMPDLLGYAEERYSSAVSWMEFFSMDGKKFIVDKDKMQQSCQQKLSEAEERYQYASIFIGAGNVEGIREKIDSARDFIDEPELCLIMASQAKADASAILSSMGLEEDSLLDYIESKSTAAEEVIAENSAEGIFPILGYSYYRYANSLKYSEKYTSLVYLEYALEMSEMGIYFPEESTLRERELEWKNEYYFLLEGMAIGFVLALLIMFLWKKK